MYTCCIAFPVKVWMWRWIRTTNIWDANRVNKIIKKTRFVIEVELDSLEKESERRMLHKLLDILDNGSHPLHSTLEEYRSDFSGRMRPTRCSTEGHRNSSSQSLSDSIPFSLFPVCQMSYFTKSNYVDWLIKWQSDWWTNLRTDWGSKWLIPIVEMHMCGTSIQLVAVYN